MRIEWRSKGEGTEALIGVGDDDAVQVFWEVTAPLIEDYLNDMTELRPDNGITTLEVEDRDPSNWGALVFARLDEGDVLYIDPEAYWDRVAFWFRDRGFDPHTWRAHHQPQSSAPRFPLH